MPNEIFSLGLNHGEIAVYTYLMFCEDRKTFQCYPSYNTIGKALDMSKNTVMKYVKNLEEKSFITIIGKIDVHNTRECRDGSGGNSRSAPTDLICWSTF